MGKSGGRVTSQKGGEGPGRHPGEARRGRGAPRGGQVSPPPMHLCCLAYPSWGSRYVTRGLEVEGLSCLRGARGPRASSRAREGPLRTPAAERARVARDAESARDPPPFPGGSRGARGNLDLGNGNSKMKIK